MPKLESQAISQEEMVKIPAAQWTKAKQKILAWLNNQGIKATAAELEEKIKSSIYPRTDGQGYGINIKVDDLIQIVEKRGEKVVVPEHIKGRNIAINILNPDAKIKLGFDDFERRLNSIAAAAKKLLKDDKKTDLDLAQAAYAAKLEACDFSSTEGFKEARKILKQAVDDFCYLIDSKNLKHARGRLKTMENDLVSTTKRDIKVQFYTSSSKAEYTLEVFKPFADISSSERRYKSERPELPNHWEVTTHALKDGDDAKPHVSTRSSSFPPIEALGQERRIGTEVMVRKKIITDINARIIKFYNEKGRLPNKAEFDHILDYKMLYNSLLSPITSVQSGPKIINAENEHTQITDALKAFEKLMAAGITYKIPEQLPPGMRSLEVPEELQGAKKIKVDVYHINTPVNKALFMPVVGNRTKKISKQMNQAALKKLVEETILSSSLKDETDIKALLSLCLTTNKLENWRALNKEINRHIKKCAESDNLDEAKKLFALVKFIQYQVEPGFQPSKQNPELYLKAYWANKVAENLGISEHVSCKSGEDRTGAYYSAVSAADSILDSLDASQIAALSASQENYDSQFKDVFIARHQRAIELSANRDVCDDCCHGARGLQIDSACFGFEVPAEEQLVGKSAKGVFEGTMSPSAEVKSSSFVVDSVDRSTSTLSALPATHEARHRPLPVTPAEAELDAVEVEVGAEASVEDEPAVRTEAASAVARDELDAVEVEVRAAAIPAGDQPEVRAEAPFPPDLDLTRQISAAALQAVAETPLPPVPPPVPKKLPSHRVRAILGDKGDAPSSSTSSATPTNGVKARYSTKGDKPNSSRINSATKNKLRKLGHTLLKLSNNVSSAAHRITGFIECYGNKTEDITKRINGEEIIRENKDQLKAISKKGMFAIRSVKSERKKPLIQIKRAKQNTFNFTAESDDSTVAMLAIALAQAAGDNNKIVISSGAPDKILALARALKNLNRDVEVTEEKIRKMSPAQKIELGKLLGGTVPPSLGGAITRSASASAVAGGTEGTPVDKKQPKSPPVQSPNTSPRQTS